jgi:hypothetical protein
VWAWLRARPIVARSRLLQIVPTSYLLVCVYGKSAERRCRKASGLTVPLTYDSGVAEVAFAASPACCTLPDLL